MEDFIFGTLATEELRQAYVRAALNGVTHRQARSPRDPLPNQTISVELTVGPLYPCEQAWVYWSQDGVEPRGAHGSAEQGSALPMELVAVEWSTLLWGYIRRFRASLPGQPAGTILRYYLTAETVQGAEVPADGGRRYACLVAEDPPPEWTREALIYQIFVDRFYPGDGKPWQQPETPKGFYGGTLSGIREKLDYLSDLGVNVLWLTPVFPSPSHHGYDATDYFEIEPRLGSKQDLHDLLDAAHQRGMRLLLDFVPNHWSHEHPTFQSAISDPDSPYRDWYTFERWPDQYDSFFGVKTLPKINLRHPEARQHILQAAAYWLGFGVDGYRIDHVLGPSPDFWADLRKVTRSVRPDCWLFGEAVDPPDVQLTFYGLLDGVLDFMLLEGLRQTFAFDRWTAVQFADYLDRHEAFFPADFSRPSFLDNHDMNRILWAMDGDTRRLKLAALCQFSLAGEPIIYYGTEVGLSQQRDVRYDGHGHPEESRLPMVWGGEQDQELFSFYRQLIAFRKSHAALRSGRRGLKFANASILAYTRGEAGEELLFVFNLAQEPGEVELRGNWEKVIFSTGSDVQLTQLNGQIVLKLAESSGVVLS